MRATPAWDFSAGKKIVDECLVLRAYVRTYDLSVVTIGLMETELGRRLRIVCTSVKRI
jgi:hypothetical protein